MNEVGWSIILLCVLVPSSLFFALNSLALSSFSRLKLQDAFEKAGKKDLLDNLLINTERLTLTCGTIRVLMNTGILLTLSFLFFSTRRYVLTFVIGVCILEFFSLIIPHAWAKHAGEYILPRTYWILRLLMYVAAPVLAIIGFHDKLVRRLAGVPDSNPESIQEDRQEEILSMVEQGKMEGIVDDEELDMIESVLELDETEAVEIMTPRTDLIAIEKNDSLNTILEAVRDKGHSRIPVYEGTIDNIIGLIYAKDLLTEIGKDPKDFNLADKMREAYFVPESKTIRDLLHEFQKQNLHIAVVLDEYGGTAGIVTIEDILEEVVGEIGDEYEKIPSESFKKIDENTFEVDARMYIDEVNDELEIELPEEEDYDTIGGFVFSHLGYIPKVGEKFDYQNLHFSITAAGPRVVKKLRIRKTPVEPGQ